MSLLDLGNDESLFYLYTPSTNRKPTVVFVNALVGSTEMWEGFIGETLRKEGFGTLSYNFRGQADSKFDLTTELTPRLIVDDLLKLLQFVTPHRPVLVGLSIGGLFAGQAIQRGLLGEGLILINTLRKPGQRLDWINDSTARAFALGGRQLLLDLMAPMLINPETLAEMRAAALLDDDYIVTAEQDGHMNLMRNAVSASIARTVTSQQCLRGSSASTRAHQCRRKRSWPRTSSRWWPPLLSTCAVCGTGRSC